jgi:hypothetical protein
MHRFLNYIEFPQMKVRHTLNDCHFSISVLEEPFGPSRPFLEMIGAVLGVVVVLSWSWTSPETGIFSSGGMGGLPFLRFFDSDSRLDRFRRRYWEDADSEAKFPKIDGELDNSPGKGRFERLTNDDYSYHNVTVSSSNRFRSSVFICIHLG